LTSVDRRRYSGIEFVPIMVECPISAGLLALQPLVS
jgi:hypothetical protein